MSLLPSKLKKTIEIIKKTKIALGNEEKQVLDSEKHNRLRLKKSLVTKSFIKKGEKLNKNNLKRKFLKPKFCEAVILSNVNVHGSISEKKSYPRISINMHFQSVNDMYGEKGSEFYKFASYDNKIDRYKHISA